MPTLPTRKCGVLGVLGVPKLLKASNYGACSEGTQTPHRWNTWCSEHLWCSSKMERSPALVLMAEHLDAASRGQALGAGMNK